MSNKRETLKKKETANKRDAPQNRRLHRLFREFRHSRPLIFAAVFLVFITLVSVFAFLSPYDPDAIDVLRKFERPGPAHWFGTDDLGRDYLTRILYGGRISLLVGVVAMLISTSIGVVVGITAGYRGGLIDSLLMRVVDILSSIPWMILVTVVSIYLRPGLQAIILVIGLFTWMSISRLVRAETLSAKEWEYVLYAQAIHQRPLVIILRHILPAVLPTIIVAATTGIANAIMMESALSFLGMGVQQPVSSWGSMLNRAQGVLGTAPYMAILPGVMILLTVYSFNKIGGAIRILAEPRTGFK
ncbi:MAG: ABC transporter permease [Spirochaetaceae bacterium]|jgi:peptide/nickel transport system permease protein|nr:ABC transporter permease [Spirochaetaceae bacterium]